MDQVPTAQDCSQYPLRIATYFDQKHLPKRFRHHLHPDWEVTGNPQLLPQHHPTCCLLACRYLVQLPGKLQIAKDLRLQVTFLSEGMKQ